MKENSHLAIGSLGFAILLGFSIYSYTRIHVISSRLDDANGQIALLDQKLASTTTMISILSASTTESQKRLANSIGYVEQKVGVIREQTSQVSTTVTTLQKLSQTDPQLLAKYSKVFFLNENYSPERLTAIPNDYKYSDSKAVSIQSDVWPHLQQLMDAARQSNIALYVSSGYRSFAEQKNLKSDYQVTYGAGTANSFSADQGYSEHQLGTALDFTTTGLGGGLDGFDKTPAFAWLLTNAYKYGFILSYPPNNQYYVFEPWHWRFVGVKLATDLRNAGKYFYDMDQRDIDKYLPDIFD